MTWKRTIFAALAFMVALLLYWTDQKLREKQIYVAVNESTFCQMNRSEITEIRLHNGSAQGEALLTREANKQWRLKKPVDAQADPEVVEQFLMNITGARKRNETEVKNLAEFGLASPEITFSLKNEAGKTFEAMLGSESTYTGQNFAKYPDSPKVFTVGEQVKSVLMRAPLDFRRSRLVEVDVGNLDNYKTISINTRESAIVLESDGKGRWRITSPIDAPAEKEVVNDYLRRIGLLRASSFISETSDRPTSMAMAVAALTSPSLSLTLERMNGSIQRLLAAPVPQAAGQPIVAQRMGDSEIMAVRPETLSAIQQDENYFRSRTLFTMKPEEIGLFSIEIGRQRTDLARNDKGQWEFVGDPERRVDQDQVNVRVDGLLKMRIKEFVDMNPRDLSIYALQLPKFKFTITSVDRSRSEGIETGRLVSGVAGSVYAHRIHDNIVFTVDVSSELAILPERVADKHFARTEFEAIDHLTIEMDQQKFAFRKEKDDWQVLRPTQTAYVSADSAKLRRVISMLNEIEYEKDHSGAGDTVIAPMDNPPVILQLFGANDKELLHFTLGKRLQQTTFVTTGKDRVFEIQNADAQNLQAVIQSLIQ